MRDDDEESVLRNVQRGDEAAYAALVEIFQQRIFRLAWRITGDAALAEDATANTLVKLWTRSGQWRGETAARTWVFRIAVRDALDVQRSQQHWWRRWSNASANAVDMRGDPAELAERAEECQVTSDRIQAALMRLTPADKALVHLYYFENRGLPEIETILRVDRATLKMRLARARKRLRQLWKIPQRE